MRALTSIKSFGSLGEDEYRALGFRGGLEIHQQLLTPSKLFCRCPAGRFSPVYDAEVLRRLRAAPPARGDYDATALMELKTRKSIIYRINRATACTYELDDAPPFAMDGYALDIALRIAVLLNCAAVGEIHVVRKPYFDGSIPTGFQRSAVVGVNGFFLFRGRRCGVKRLTLEEDSCRLVADAAHVRTFLTDRFGTPLTEIATDADFQTPREMAEAGNYLRRLTRATGLVRTGIGAARQDVNVSIAGGSRSEIKGVPKLALVPRLAHNEAQRQGALLALRAELKNRGVTKTSFRAAVADVTADFAPESGMPPGRAANAGGRVYAVALAGFAGIPAARTQETKIFLDELSERARVIACLDHSPVVWESGVARDALDDNIWRRIKRRCRAGGGDSVVLVWGPAEDARLAADEIVVRAKETTVGVPAESREAQRDGATAFKRFLPDPERVYPDADHLPIAVTEERVAAAAENAGEPVGAREERYRRWGVPEDCIGRLATSPWSTTFEKLVKNYDAEPKLAATVIMHRMTGWRRRGWNTAKVTPADLERTFSLYRQKKVTRDGVVAALAAYVAADRPLRQILNDMTRRREAEARLPTIITNLKKKIRRRIFRNGRESVRRFAMGELMAELRGLIPADALTRVVDAEILPAGVRADAGGGK